MAARESRFQKIKARVISREDLGLDVDLARAATGVGDLHNLDIGCDGAGSVGNSRLVLVLLGLVELVLCIRQRYRESEEERAGFRNSGGCLRRDLE